MSFQPKQKPVVQQAGIIDAIVIDDQRTGHGAEVDQMVPVTVVSGQTRCFQCEHCSDLAGTDRSQQPSEAGTFD